MTRKTKEDTVRHSQHGCQARREADAGYVALHNWLLMQGTEAQAPKTMSL